MRRAREEEKVNNSAEKDENSDGYTTVTGTKRKERSSPGAQNDQKKSKFQSEAEAKIVRDMYLNMGLEKFM